MTDAADRIKHRTLCSRRAPSVVYDLITKCSECHHSAPNNPGDDSPGVCEGCGGKCAMGRTRCHRCKTMASPEPNHADTPDGRTPYVGREATLATCERLGVPMLAFNEHGDATILRRVADLTTPTPHRGWTPSDPIRRTVGEAALTFGTHRPLVSGGAQDG